MKKSLSKLTLGRLASLFCGAMALMLTSCLDKGADDFPAPTPVSYVSFYHGSPDAPDFNVLIDNQRINSQAFKYSNASNYISLATGSHKVEFTSVTSTSAIVDTTFNFQQDKIYSLFTVNRLEDIEMLVVQDSLITPGSGKAGVRLVHLSPDAPAVDVAIAGGGADQVFANLGFKGDTKFKEVTSGTYSFQVKETGTGNALIPATSLTLESGRSYTLVVRGFQTPPTGNTSALALQIVRNY